MATGFCRLLFMITLALAAAPARADDDKAQGLTFGGFKLYPVLTLSEEYDDNKRARTFSAG